MHEYAGFRVLARSIAIAMLAVTTTSGSVQTGAWHEYASSSGRFKVSMPGEPSFATGTTETDLGPVTMHSQTLTTDQLYCSVVYYDMPEGLKRSDGDLLAGLCNGFVSGAKVRETANRKDVTLDGYAGRELEGESNDGTFRVVLRYYVVRPRIYMVMIGVPADDLGSPLVPKFLDSFKVVAADQR